MRVQDLTAESRNPIASDEGVKMRYVHTCYRVLDLDRSIDFYKDKLGLELVRKVPIGDDATNAFFSVPGDPEPSHTNSAPATATSPSPSKTSTPWRRSSKRPAA